MTKLQHEIAPQNNLSFDFYRQAQNQPEQMALWVDGRSWSYAELAEQVAPLAGRISARFPEAGVNIGIMANRSIETYVGLLAVLWSGNAYVPLNPKLPQSYLRTIIERAEIVCILADQPGSDLLDAELRDGLSLGILSPAQPHNPIGMGTSFTSNDLAADSPLTAPVAVSPEQTAYLMFTSGSTGSPKGIAATVGNVAYFLKATQERYQLTSEDRFSQYNDLTWDPSIFDLFSAWKVGASVHVVPETQMFAPAHFIRAQKLSVWYSGPVLISLLEQMRQLRAESLPTLKLSLFVGEPLLEVAAENWQAAAPQSLVENVYGPTETTVVCTGQPYTRTSACLTPQRGYMAIGTPYTGCHVEIVDTQNNFLPAGEIGEIAIGGPIVTPGYWRDPQLTEQVFPTLEHPQLGQTRWYLTGDIGKRDTDGTFHFLGRRDNQVKLRSLRIELEEVEHHLRTATKSNEVAVFAWPVENGVTQGLLAFIGGSEIDNSRLRRTLPSHMPNYMIPAQFRFLPALPRNANGKIDRKALRTQLELEIQ